MRLVVALVGLAALVAVALAEDQEQDQGSSKTKETRTALHVARSLDPADMEEMTVRTKTGETTTLLVKRRERDRHGRRVALPLPPVKQVEQREGRGEEKGAVPDPVTVRSTPVLVKGVGGGEWGKRGRSVTSVDEDGVPVVEGVRVPDDPIDKVQVWRNARVIDGKLVPYEKNHVGVGAKHGSGEVKPPREEVPVQWTKLEPVRPWRNPAPIPAPSPVSVSRPTLQIVEQEDDASGLDPSGRYVRDRILEYIKRINAQEVTSRAQAQAQPSRGARAMAMGDGRAEARVLQPAGASVYPTSLLYSPPSVVSRVSFEEGVRTPVLQYAHPELGVQPAKLVGSGRVAADQPSDRREQALAYFAHDIHADRSPYAFEPGLEDEAARQTQDGADQADGGNGVAPLPPQRPRKTLPYFTAPDKYYTSYGHPPSPYRVYDDDRPFWQRVSDSIRQHVQTSMDRMSELTAPVVDPLVEASHKISKNLGLEGGVGGGGRGELDTLKEKLGLAGSPSVVLPALGLVAGGAALGLGAVAVGRYLDVDVLQRSRQTDGSVGEVEEETSAEHKRALEAVNTVPQVEQVKAEAEARRRRRSTVGDDEEVDAAQTLTEEAGAAEGMSGAVGVAGAGAVWASTPCAKRVFCEAMLAQPDDALVRLTEKKMATYVDMLSGAGGGAGDATVVWHLGDVMRAVRAGDCSPFACFSAGPRR